MTKKNISTRMNNIRIPIKIELRYVTKHPPTGSAKNDYMFDIYTNGLKSTTLIIGEDSIKDVRDSVTEIIESVIKYKINR